MLRDALSYPLNSDDRIATILIGGVLTLLSGFIPILPQAILQGYGVRVLRSAAKDEPAAPSFTDWGTLIVDGIKVLLITLAYALVVIVPVLTLSVVLGIGGQMVTGATPPPSGTDGAVGGVAAGASVLAFLVVTLVVAYVLPAAYANFAVEGSLGAAFDLSTLTEATLTSEYFKAWVLAAAVGVVLGSLGAVLSLLLVGVVVLFYAQVVTFYLFGRGFADGISKKRRAVAETTF